MSFQWIIDNAETITINRRPVVSSTTARDGTTRAVSRGNAPWKFDVKVADGIPWTTLRQYISQAEKLDRHTVGTINFSHSGYSWLVKYQGDMTGITSFSGNWTQGSTSLTVTGGTGSSGYKFRAGDFIQLGTGGVYMVTTDATYNTNNIQVHRPIIQATGSGQIKVGPACTWTVMCTSFPDWTLMARDQVSWSGSFTFVESLV